MGLFPGLWECFEEPFNPRARFIYRHYLNPFRLVKLSASRIEELFRKLTPQVRCEVLKRETVALRAVSRCLTGFYRPAREAGLMTDASFRTWTEEVTLELDLIETEEKQMSKLEEKISTLYARAHPQDHLGTIPGVGPHTAPLLLASIGDINRFRDAKAFCQWTGILPRSHQSSRTQVLGMSMAKAGPARVKRALYQSGEYARRWDPDLAAVYFRQMVDYGKSHKQAMGAVMTHLATRIYVVLKEQRPYCLKDTEGHNLTMAEGKKLISLRFRVPEEVRRLRRHHHRPTKKSMRQELIDLMGRLEDVPAYEAAIAPQRDNATSRPRIKDNTAQPVGQLVVKAIDIV